MGLNKHKKLRSSIDPRERVEVPKRPRPRPPEQTTPRRAPKFYAGETYGQREIQHNDVERYPNGAIPGIRDKFARRLIRGALKRRFSSVEQSVNLARAMRAQAYDVADDENKSGRWARRLLAKELALHTTVYVPENLRAERTKKRRLKRLGRKDAIAQLVDKMTEQRR
jgi:hypothetical protein